MFQPAAICFHDKRLSDEATWQSTGAESYYSAEAGLMMAHKWSRPDLVKSALNFFVGSGDTNLEKAAKVFLDREAAGTLPKPRDPKHKIAEFDGFMYAKHRFEL